MRLRSFLYQTLYRDADMVDRALEVGGLFVGGLATFYDWGNFDSWALGQRFLTGGAILAFALMVVFCRRAYQLADAAEPKIELRFAPTEKFIRDVPYQIVRQALGTVPYADTGVARYIGVEAINRSTRTARECSAYLLAVKRVGPDGELLDTEFDEVMKLNWSNVDVGTINLDSEIHYMFNILFVVDQKNEIQFAFADAYPLKLNRLCAEPGDYRMRVRVGGTDANSENLAILLKWTGNMESTTAELA